MPYAINEEAMSTARSLDIANPPVVNIPHMEFPKMVYLHPKDKAREHAIKIVQNTEELKAAEKIGWRTKPHVPVVPDAIVESGEYETRPSV